MIPADFGTMCRAHFDRQFNLAVKTDELVLGRDDDLWGVVQVVAVGGDNGLLLHGQLFGHASGAHLQDLCFTASCLLLHNGFSKKVPFLLIHRMYKIMVDIPLGNCLSSCMIIYFTPGPLVYIALHHYYNDYGTQH